MRQLLASIRDRILNRLFKHRTIVNCFGNKFLTRWHILRTKRFAIMLHCFHRSDEDRALHDHPWTFVSLLLWPGYNEITEAGKARKIPGMILYRPAEWRHRVELLDKRESWSLVLHLRRRREWYYHYPNGPIHHAQWWQENCE